MFKFLFTHLISYLPSNDLSLVITDSSNFIIRVVPLCQCAVTLAGYNKSNNSYHNLVANDINV